ncbi:nuclear transport factor 2 family protein [Sphingomonas prati]|uniref:Ketosteroid isomerase-like protein n=1 Tax=Sphingomonas prati TaxID=1843237 RepID=A0A7W9F2A6_9SPHN|nr:nuclear transport factor 2 family protein [Sphingomonas prati]MBB5730322.1 ketosteroid isomerase-like protein [Sphingomonas prati]GGE93213.1 polyketide cyclase [Sphingomonas prati]
MTVTLPGTIAAYFEADAAGDAGAVARCFAKDGVVKDEGETHVGGAAIGQWKANASSQYHYTVEPFAVATEGDRTIVTAHVAGDFPGSPTDLRYRFVLAGGKIAELEIVP